MKSDHITDTVLMVRPAHFCFNAETADSNSYQNSDNSNPEEIMALAVSEFDRLAEQLKNEGVNVVVVQDTDSPIKPDAIFPNNWVSFHDDGTVILYPMLAPNRRLERRHDVIDMLQREYDLSVLNVTDLTASEAHGEYLEGTGSMVFDHANKVIYAALSPRTHKKPLESLAELLGYKPVMVHAKDFKGKDIYHTNVLMCLGDAFAIICLEAIPDAGERERIVSSLIETGHEVVSITFEQMNHFAGNALLIKNVSNEKLLVMSEQAYKSLSEDQLSVLKKYARIVTSPIYTIEKYGGGSARCMLAEVFLPKM